MWASGIVVLHHLTPEVQELLGEEKQLVYNINTLLCGVNFSFLQSYSQEDRYYTKSLKKKYSRTNILKTFTSLGFRMNEQFASIGPFACNVDKFKAVIKFVTKFLTLLQF